MHPGAAKTRYSGTGAGPAWVPLLDRDTLEAVVNLRDVMAWCGWGSSGGPDEELGGRSMLLDDGAQSDAWQSPEVCLALVLLAQEQAAAVLRATGAAARQPQ
jgi:hypothetical protein